jgi:hypothetical protein
MTQAKSVHSTPRRTASKIQPQKPALLRAIDPTNLPDEYCLSLDGDCLKPLIPDGAAVKLKKSEKFAVGDMVCIWFRPECVPAGSNRGWLKRVAFNLPLWVKKFPYSDHPESNVKAILIVEQINPARQYRVPCDQILAVHKAIGYVPAGAPIGGTIKASDVLPIPVGKAVV